MVIESPLLAFLIVAFAVAGSMLVGAKLLRVRAKHSSPLKPTTYECGESPAGPAWVRFHARYYVVALFFVVFDIEAAFLFPWALVVREAGTAGLVAVFSFVAVLMVGWLWAVKKGALRWQ
ncbi:MAG: NADH-quinone oxidoreductase subunit A [Planctomycetes bacterium]|nr:NADH-quinone oxidoreductase subunit A [Planctomycetota bacterium]